jgi:hypothetical protein
MAGDRHFAQAARAWCEKALARLLPDLDRGASCPAFKRTPSVKQLSALRTAEPSSPAHPIHKWTLSPVKALLKADVVGAGGVEPPSSSVSDPTSLCRPVSRMVRDREGSMESRR